MYRSALLWVFRELCLCAAVIYLCTHCEHTALLFSLCIWFLRGRPAKRYIKGGGGGRERERVRQVRAYEIYKWDYRVWNLNFPSSSRCRVDFALQFHAAFLPNAIWINGESERHLVSNWCLTFNSLDAMLCMQIGADRQKGRNECV